MQTMDPPLEFSPFIQSYWYLEDEATLGLDGGVELVFNLGDPVDVCLAVRAPERVTGHFLLGGLSRRVAFRGPGDLNLFGVRFRPCGVFPFLSMPQMEFAAQCVVFEELWELMGLGVEKVARERGRGAAHYAVAFNDFFADRMNAFESYSRTMVTAVAAIRRVSGDLSMEALAAECGVSRRHLERLFDHRIGVSPKHLARMFRLSHALGNLPSLGFADTAALCGFFDQSHLIRECRSLADFSPSQLGA